MRYRCILFASLSWVAMHLSAHPASAVCKTKGNEADCPATANITSSTGLHVDASTVSPVFLRHPISFWITVVDRDHCCAGNTVTHPYEDRFYYRWAIKEGISGYTVDSDEGYGGATGTWSFQSTGAIRPGNYTCEVQVNDTPEDGDATGDDGWTDAFTVPFAVDFPKVRNYHITQGPTNQGGGVLYVQTGWLPSCCDNLAHLSLTTVREHVTYEPRWTSGQSHRLSHDGGNCWTVSFADPTHSPQPDGRSGTFGYVDDTHSMPASGHKDSTCVGSQVEQEACDFPNRPALVPSSTMYGYSAVAGPAATATITRRVYEDPPGTWWYKCNKWGVSAITQIP